MSPSPSADVESPDSPKTSPSLQGTGPASLPTSSLFLPPKGPAAPLPPPSSSSTTEATSSLPPADDAAGPIWSGDFEDEPETSEKSPSSDTPSTGSGGIQVSKAGLRAAVVKGLRTVTSVLSRVAATPLEQEFGVWRADDEDLRDISDPAHRMIWRRVPAEARTSDTIDLVVLGLALIGYVAKNMDRKAELRTAAADADVPSPADAMAAAAGTAPVPAWAP